MKRNHARNHVMSGLWVGAAVIIGLILISQPALAKTVKVTMHAQEVDQPIDNKGTLYPMWTFDGTAPGPVVRVTEGDEVDFTLINDGTNKNSHSMDFHAARVNVVGEFAPVKPGQTKTFKFKATYPGIFFYHCGADPMVQHVARGMFGAIIVDPKDGGALPKTDREYVLIQSEIYKNAEDKDTMMAGKWDNVVFNMGILKYDPVHDPQGTKMLFAKPGERVRIYFVNAGPNEFSAFHPIAGIWDRVYPTGNPKNAMYGLQTYTVGPGDAAIFDVISPVEGANALVTHSLKAALTGAIAVLMFNKEFPKDVDPNMGKGSNILVR